MTRRRAPRLEQELTWRRAAAALGRIDDLDGRKLKSLILAREKQTGRHIALRPGGEKAPKLRITIAAIHRAFPELRSAHADGLALSIRHLAMELDARHDGRTKVMIHQELDGDIRPRVEILEKKVRVMNRCLAELNALDQEASTRIDRTGPSR